MKKTAQAWIENNPQTGEIKPWEVWFKVEGSCACRVSSCKDESAAKKSQEKLIKRNEPYYNIVTPEI